MTWIELVNALRDHHPTFADDEDCLHAQPELDVLVRVSHSRAAGEIGLLADVAPAAGLDDRELAAARRIPIRGALIVFGGRVVLRERLRLDGLDARQLVPLMDAVVEGVRDLRARWTRLAA